VKVLKFGAIWCSGCLVMKPRWAEIEAENPWLETVMYDFDQDQEAVKKYGIDDKLPVFILLDKNGDEFLRLTGEIEKEKLVNIINENKDQ